MVKSIFAGVLLVFLCVSASPAQEPGCRQIDQWVKEHKATLPGNYDEFVASPSLYRRAIFAALPADVQGKLWIAQLEKYRADHPELNADQLSVVQDALDLLVSPDFFAIRPGTVLWKARVSRPLSELRKSAEAAFGRDAAQAVFGQLGGTPEGAFELTRAGGLPVKATPPCNCSQVSDYCGSGTFCAAITCVRQTGCGTLWRYACDGLCAFP